MTGSWDTTSSTLKYTGTYLGQTLTSQPVVLHGFALTSLQYILSKAYDSANPTRTFFPFNNGSFDVSDTSELDAIMKYLTVPTHFIPNEITVIPAARISLNAAYYLGIQYPDMTDQYKQLVNSMVTYFTGKGVVCILDLHWNDDVTQQQYGMALSNSVISQTGDSKQFWETLSTTPGYQNNPLVWFELYNEPFVGYNNGWFSQSTSSNSNKFWGMNDLYEAIRANSNNVIVIGGALDYAYDFASLITFNSTVKPKNVVYNFHPYMGPYQKSDSSKTPENFEIIINEMLQTNTPIIITELGQYCCGDNQCYAYTGSYGANFPNPNDKPNISYVNAILEIAKRYTISWLLWGWRPNSSYDLPQCSQPDINDDRTSPPSLISTSPCTGNTNGDGCMGADFKTLFSNYYSPSPTGTLCLSMAPIDNVDPSQLQPSQAVSVDFINYFYISTFNTPVCQNLTPGEYLLGPPSISFGCLQFNNTGPSSTIITANQTNNQTLTYSNAPSTPFTCSASISSSNSWTVPNTSNYASYVTIKITTNAQNPCTINVPWTSTIANSSFVAISNIPGNIQSASCSNGTITVTSLNESWATLAPNSSFSFGLQIESSTNNFTNAEITLDGTVCTQT